MGAFAGRTAVVNGEPTMVEWRYVDRTTVMPAHDEVRALGPDS